MKYMNMKVEYVKPIVERMQVELECQLMAGSITATSTDNDVNLGYGGKVDSESGPTSADSKPFGGSIFD